ncbi:MAG: NAD(P)H-hydrate dehydratase [Candidatus Caldatribacteriaceae bacterium]
MIDLLSAETMQNLEKGYCQTWGVDTRLLMENAGRKVAEEAAQIITSLRLKEVFVVCGVGNNGGDGLVVARHLKSQFPFLKITVYFLGERGKMTKDAAFNYDLLTHLDVVLKEVSSSQDICFAKDSLVVDALFGTGLKRKPEGVFAEAIEKMNRSLCFVLSIDVPSGVDATKGLVWSNAVKANLTVTLGKIKQGLVQFPAREYVGKLKLSDIGIPLPLKGRADAYLLTPQDVKALLPQRDWGTHKISAGVLGVIAGSSAMLGAGILLTLGAYGVGAGMVIWPLPNTYASLVKTILPELVSVVLALRFSSEDFHYTLGDFQTIKEGIEARRCQCLAIGPGLGTKRSTVFLLGRLLEEIPMGGVLDADALNSIALDRNYWKGKLSGWVLTPHEGEMARLLGTSVAEIHQDRISACRACAQYFGSVTVLKGAGTVIASPSGDVVINPTGGSNLATAGSGDVLTGIIGGIMAQGLGAWESALCGVFLHGLAGDLLEKEGKKTITAREIVYKVNEARKVIENGEYTIPFLVGDRCSEPQT